MIHINLKKQIEKLLHIHDSPERTALAFAIGVFFGFSPFLGFHTILVLLVAFLFRLNRVASLIGVYLNNPWTIVPVAMASTSLGAKVLGFRGHRYERFNWHELGTPLFWSNLPQEFRLHYRTLYPFLVGSMICATVLAIIAYPVCLWFIRTYRHRIQHLKD
ncbi:MAG: DUF2062 domain-containing protein [Terriglobia bacterium]